MAICPFATFDQISGGLGAFAGGPFKIVHHTTEGSTYAGARSAFASNKSDPHFTVEGDRIFQHIDTAQTARALRNAPGGVQTNRDSAVQIEVVGFAGRAKDVTTLKAVARLCRWIEGQHGVAQRWPNGAPRVSTNGRDPGGHNRNATTWDAEGGHYGHSQVPENTHWDPGYTAAELAIVTPDAPFAAPAPAPAMAVAAPDAGLDPHDALGNAGVVSGVGDDGRGVPDADDIAERVLTRLSERTAFARVTVRVVVGGVEVEVTAERGRAKRTPAVKRSRRRGKSRRR
jgi:hypothetical protein